MRTAIAALARRRLQGVLLLAAVALLGGCVAAAAGAGAAAGVYLTKQGASGVVQGSVADVEGRARAALTAMGVEITERKPEGREVEFHGKANGMDVVVELSPAGASTTKVSASARKNMVEWDKEYARSIVQSIVDRQ